MIYDLIIIGMGPAGIAAGIYAKRSGLNVLILERGVPGGMLNYTNFIENYPGLGEIRGPEVAYKMFEHINHLQIPYKIEEVKELKHDKEIKKIITKKNQYQAKAIIIATGRVSKKLAITNADKYEGKGISYCAICDGTLYKDKDIAILGAGNSALEEAIFLSDICKSVTIINRSKIIRGDEELQQRVKAIDNITILYDVKIKELKGNEFLEKVVLNNNTELEVAGLFVYIGFVPATDFAKDLNITNSKGAIVVDRDFQTKVEGIFACGDIIEKELYQIITASSEGASAAISAYKYVRKH